jgi:exosortase C (VPDSG-CTERM-specific)
MPPDEAIKVTDENSRLAAPRSSPNPVTRRFNFFAGWPGLVVFTVVLALCFGKPLYDLICYATHSSLYSHIPLIPFISLYLARLKRPELTRSSEPLRWLAALPWLAGVAALGAYWFVFRSEWKPGTNDYLTLTVFAFVSLFIGGCLFFLGRDTVRALTFPLAFLLFMVPFPSFLTDWIETFFQYTSAEAAHAMIGLSGTPVFRDGLNLRVPGVPLRVAQECSGIHSSLVLIITSLVAGQLFLRSPWKRAMLAVAVIPLAILRNGFRIFTIAQLCVRISPDMIHSWIHRHGGPVFFALSLVPFFALLLLLRKSELRAGHAAKLKSHP